MLFPDFYILTCSNGTDKCVSQIASENSINIFLGFFAAIAILGLFFNSICVYVFYFTPSMNSRFITSLKIYSINSLLISLSDFINSLFFFICNRIIWVYNDTLYFTMPEHIFYYTYIYIPIWTILYTIGSSLDIFIVYGRIQVLYPKLKFLGTISAYKISALVIVLSILINLPPNLGRQLDKFTLNLETNQTLFLSKYGPSSYTNDYNFKQLVVASNSIRDFGIVLVEVGMNIVLFVMLRRYNARMVEITMSYQEKARNNNKLKNITIAIMLCFLSIVHHAVVFVPYILLLNGSMGLFGMFTFISGIIHSAKHSVNLFLFYSLNTKFRNGVNRILPFLKKKPANLLELTIRFKESNKNNN